MADDALAVIRSTLADLRDEEFEALGAATYVEPQAAPGLLAWIEHAADSEVHGHHGRFPLRAPEEAIDPSEDEAAIAATITLRDVFADYDPRTTAFFHGAIRSADGAW